MTTIVVFSVLHIISFSILTQDCIFAFAGWVDPDTAADKKFLTSYTGIMLVAVGLHSSLCYFMSRAAGL